MQSPNPVVMPYVHQDYPRWVYHATEAAREVADAAAHLALGAGWFAHPNDVPSQTAPAAEPVATERGPLAVTGEVLTAIAAELLAGEATTVTTTPAEPLIDVDALRALADAEAAKAEAEKAAQAEAAQKDAQWNAPHAAIIEKLVGTSVEILERVKRFEQENPKGPRKALLKAVEAALLAAAGAK